MGNHQEDGGEAYGGLSRPDHPAGGSRYTLYPGQLKRIIMHAMQINSRLLTEAKMTLVKGSKEKKKTWKILLRKRKEKGTLSIQHIN